MADAFAGRNQLSRRETIQDLLFAGLQVRDIMDVTGYLRSQIRRVADRIANSRGMDSLTGSRRPRQNSAVGMGYLDAIAGKHGRWSSKTMARYLEQDLPDEAVTDRTVPCSLHHDLNFKYGKLWRKFKLTELQKDNRVVWCLLHSDDDWEQTIFLVESCLALTPTGVRSWYLANNRALVFEAEQFPKKNCTFWALFRRSERLVPLCSLSGSSRGTLSVPSRLWTSTFCPWLVNGLATTTASNSGMPHHTPRTQPSNCPPPPPPQAQGVDLFFQSANSPGLQPIENIWGLIKERISRRDDIVTTDDLRQVLNNEWARLGPDETAPFVESMPRRLTECLEAGRAHTHYLRRRVCRLRKLIFFSEAPHVFFVIGFFQKHHNNIEGSRKLPLLLINRRSVPAARVKPPFSHARSRAFIEVTITRNHLILRDQNSVLIIWII